MKRELNEMWKEVEGSKVYWMVQGENGRLSFRRKKDAVRWVECMKESMEMKKMVESVKTNYGEWKSYSLCDGNNREGWTMQLKKSCGETDKEFFKRLVSYGYTTISFYEVSTRIRGLHETIAYCKR